MDQVIANICLWKLSKPILKIWVNGLYPCRAGYKNLRIFCQQDAGQKIRRSGIQTLFLWRSGRRRSFFGFIGILLDLFTPFLLSFLLFLFQFFLALFVLIIHCWHW